MNSSADLPVQRALKRLGTNISKARLRRRMTRRDFADQMGVSLSTARRLEEGALGVALQTLASGLRVLGKLDEFNRLLDPDRDTIGHVVQDEHLLKRGHRSSAGVAL